MQFIDEATIEISAGRGGDGIVAWRREKYVPKGGPAGGDGGHGGSLYLLADPELNTLVEFRFKRKFAAESGKPGGTSNKSGRAGEDLVIPVPVGTLVYKSTEMQSEALLADLAHPGQRVLVARGGKGGLGNQHFATAARQAPDYAIRGEAGEECNLRLELKLLADVGIVGVPNAGKSTLLSVITAARPKIADYPFTTIEPQLGVVRLDDERSFVAVDVPGLIEGAHEGAGLGDRFLRHVERTRILVHLLDGAKSLDEMASDRATIEAELRAWNPALPEKPTIVVVSKLDLPDARERFASLHEEDSQTMGISAATHQGIPELLAAMWRALALAPPPAEIDLTPAQIALPTRETFTVSRDDDGTFVVTGERVEQLAERTNFDSDEALARFERALVKMGVEKELQARGVREGDSVRIGTYEFTYS